MDALDAMVTALTGIEVDAGSEVAQAKIQNKISDRQKEQYGRAKKFFESNDAKFLAACKNVPIAQSGTNKVGGVVPSCRQASKWLHKKGAAYKYGR